MITITASFLSSLSAPAAEIEFRALLPIQPAIHPSNQFYSILYSMQPAKPKKQTLSKDTEEEG